MRVIITGGTGLIGRELVALLAEEDEIIVLSRNPNAYAGIFPAGVRVERWDAQTGDGWHPLITGETALVNLAGENFAADMRLTDEHKDRILQSRVDAGKAIMDGIDRASEQPHVLLQASAVGYYGDRGKELLTENSLQGTGFRAEVCVLWEKVTEGLPVRQAVLRIGDVLDTEGGLLPALLRASRFFGSQLGNGSQYIPWVHNYDVAAAMRFIIHNERLDGAFNLCAPHPVTNWDMFQALSRVTQNPALFPVPEFALKLMYGELAEAVLDSQRVIPERLINAGYAFMHPMIEPALRDLLNVRKRPLGDEYEIISNP